MTIDCTKTRIGNRAMLFLLFLFAAMSTLCPVTSRADDLVIAQQGASSYQIVIPNSTDDEVVGWWLLNTAELMQTAFQRNGFAVPVVQESAKVANKPGIYLGATELAKRNNIVLEANDWSYVQKVVGNDIVIVGKDIKNRPLPTSTGTTVQLALLGTVKGSLDFMREYMGVRFLFNNKSARTNPDAYGADGRFPLDTRSVGFISVKRIAVPADLDVQKTPPVRARLFGSYRAENFYAIANNYFPTMDVSDTDPAVIHMDSIVEQGKKQPEFFALMPDGKRSNEKRIGKQLLTSGQLPIDILNPDVIDYLYSLVEEQVKKGHNTVRIYPLDGNYAIRDTSERSNAFFGITALNDDEVRARGRTGKQWLVYFQVADRLRKNYPQAKIIVLNYQDTPVNAKVVQGFPDKKFPDNVMVQYQYGTPQTFDRLEGVEIPAGIMGYEETFTGFGLDGPYAPEHTPEYAAKMAQAVVQHKVQIALRDGSMNVWGLQAPVYYVYGRMIDDPAMDYKDVEKEFYTAAFGEVAPQMTRFFDLLHDQIDLYSDFFGLYQPAWTGAHNARYGRSRDNKWHHQSIYTVEFVTRANTLLAAAERNAKDPDVKARLHLLRIDFDYVSDIGKIFALQDAWTLNPTQANLDVLLDKLDDWHNGLKTLAEGIGNSRMKSLKDWPEMRPFDGDMYRNVALERSSYQNSGWLRTSLNWDTAAIREHAVNGKYVSPNQASVGMANEIPGIASGAWDKVPATVMNNAMPMAISRTAFQMLRDSNNIYVRIDSRLMANARRSALITINKTLKPKDEKDIFKQEYAQIKLQPKAGGPTYCFAANPVDGIRYDAVMNPAEDTSWNGQWKFEYQIEEDPKAYPHWVAWFAIPYSDLGVKTPAAGETWNVTAVRKGLKGEGTLTWRGEAQF